MKNDNYKINVFEPKMTVAQGATRECMRWTSHEDRINAVKGFLFVVDILFVISGFMLTWTGGWMSFVYKDPIYLTVMWIGVGILSVAVLPWVIIGITLLSKRVYGQLVIYYNQYKRKQQYQEMEDDLL